MPAGSFSAGLSELNANTVYPDVIGNHLANTNTIGFESSAVTFMDLGDQTTSGSSVHPTQVGVNVVTRSASAVFNHVAIESTSKAIYAAIQGNRFLVVRVNDSGRFRTSAGNFSLDNDGALVTPHADKVQEFTQLDPLAASQCCIVAPRIEGLDPLRRGLRLAASASLPVAVRPCA
jgi:flagellar hook protein FlgE